QDAPLPPLLRRRVPGPLHYSVTSHTVHHPKPVDVVLRNVIYSNAPPHWCTHFLNRLPQKLRDSRSVKLVSAPPVSEMQEQYRGRSAPDEPLEPHYRTLRALHGQLHQASVLLQGEPALSTAHSDYRRFSRSESTPPSASPNRRPFPERPALIHPPSQQTPPCTSSQLRLPRPSIPVSYGGRSSVYMGSFSAPARPPVSSTRVLARTEETGPDPLQHVLGVPEMYSTENKTYGTGRTVLV
ncbi:hypothetical protein C0J45_12430, partial [Silurus meridionalis]